MKTRLLVLCLGLCLYSNATTYYFSSSSGDDARTAGQANNPSTPWKSIEKLNTIFSSLSPGDSVLFKRGDVFYGSLKITKPGTPTAPIVIGAFGIGNKPIITGLISVNNWISIGMGVWQSSSSIPSISSTYMFILNGTQYPMGRFPNENTTNKGYLTIDSHVGATAITDNQLTSIPNWKGATAVVRTNNYIIDTSRIASHSGTSITLEKQVTYELINGFGYFIQNHPATLDKYGEWYFNPSDRKLSVYFGSSIPPTAQVKIASLNDLITIYKVGYISITDLHLQGANRTAINITGAPGITVRNCHLDFIGDKGINAIYSGTINFTAENNQLADINNFGIDLRTAGSNQQVRHNTLRRIGIYPGMGGTGTQNRVGISSNSGSNHFIEFNRIDSIGYAGIRFNSDYTTVRNNVISNFNLTTDDGGGIYTANHNGTEKFGRKILNNIIFNGIGNKEGTNITSPATYGIYLDDNSSGVEVAGNTVFKCSRAGIYVHNAFNMNIHNNTFFDNLAQIQALHNAYPSIRNITLQNNIFFSKLPENDVAKFYTKENDIASFGNFDINYYVRPLADSLVIRTITGFGTGSTQKTARHTLAGWKKTYSHDPNSKNSPFRYSQKDNPDDHILFLYNDGNEKKTFKLDALYADVKNVTYSNQVVLAPYTSIILLKIGNLINTAPIVRLNSPTKDTTVSYFASVTLTAEVTDAENNVKTVDFFSGSSLIGTDSIFPYNISWKPTSTGNHMISVKATDQKELTGISSTITLSVVEPPNIKPLVEITSPKNGQQFSVSGQVAIEAKASDTDGTIQKIDFYANGALIGSDDSSPYSLNYQALGSGTHILLCKAIDNDNDTGTSSSLQITVAVAENLAPSVIITAPIQDYVTADTNLILTATASDSDGSVSKVDFYSGTTHVGSDNTFPYSINWTAPGEGSYVLSARVTDNLGICTTSKAVTFWVKYPDIHPRVQITSPAADQQFQGPATVNLKAEAIDPDGTIAKVDFFYDSILIGSDNSAPYSIYWSNILGGVYTITARATDNEGLVTSSEKVSITVVTSNQPPVVALYGPVVGRNYAYQEQVLLEATAYDADGLVKTVNFFSGSTLLGSDNSYPFSFIWNNPSPGTHVLTAEAVDNDSALAKSEGINIHVSAPITIEQSSTSVAPNPVSNKLYIYPDDNMKRGVIRISILTLTGLTAKSMETDWQNGRIMVNTGSLKPGTYILNLIAQNYLYSTKFLKY